MTLIAIDRLDWPALDEFAEQAVATDVERDAALAEIERDLAPALDRLAGDVRELDGPRAMVLRGAVLFATLRRVTHVCSHVEHASPPRANGPRMVINLTSGTATCVRPGCIRVAAEHWTDDSHCELRGALSACRACDG